MRRMHFGKRYTTNRMFSRQTDQMKPRSITIFFLDGDPNGIRVAQISMSTIQAVAFRRNQLRRVREAFPEIKKAGRVHPDRR